MVVLELLAAGDGDGEGVADAYGAPEIQPLRHIYRAGAGEFGAQDRGDQGAAPHAVADHLAKLAGAGELGIDVGRIDIARHQGKEVDVARAQCPHELCVITHLNLVEGLVFYEL